MRITIVGASSYRWTPILLRDLAVRKSWRAADPPVPDPDAASAVLDEQTRNPMTRCSGDFGNRTRDGVDFGAARRARQRLKRAGIDTRYDGRTVVIGIDAAGMPAGYRVYTIYVRERDLPVARRVTLSIQTERFD